MKGRYAMFFVVAVLQWVVASSAQARVFEVLVRSSEVITTESGEAVLHLSVPAWLSSWRVEYATIEFVLEAPAGARGYRTHRGHSRLTEKNEARSGTITGAGQYVSV
jgi:hypothetical protein